MEEEKIHMRDPVEDSVTVLGAGLGPGKIVAVTGAAGFIGGRIVELLRQRPGRDRVEVRAYTRRRSRPGLQTLRLEDVTSVGRALLGCGVLIHCAFDFHNMAANLRIAHVLGPICAARGVRLILLSSAAIYEPFPEGVFDETAPIETVNVPYSDTKISIEEAFIEQSHTLGLDVVILQPTCVYGPHGRQWTDAPARELLTGRVVLPNEGRGICNAVYVDDVCAATIAAIDADIESGGRFIVSGPRAITWNDFFLGLKTALGTGTVSAMSPDSRVEPSRVPATSPGKTMLLRMAARMMQPSARLRIKFALQRLRAGGREIVHIPKGAKFHLYASTGIASTTKAHRLLGWEPQIGFDQGMALTAAYLQSAFATDITRAQRRGRIARAGSTTQSPAASVVKHP
jgi:nucleoside-diphosphate-sugar epimerase